MPALPGSNNDNATAVEGVELKPGDSIRAHYTSAAAGDYWSALGIPLVEGRFLEDADNHRKPHVCVVDEAFAKRYWPNQSALGHRIANGAVFTEDSAHTIVGVVSTVKQNDLTESEPRGSIYYPYVASPSTGFSVVVRTPMAPEALASTLKRTVLAIDPELPVDDLKPMQARVEDSLVARRSPALLSGIFSGVALLLTSVGTYGVLRLCGQPAPARDRRSNGPRGDAAAGPCAIPEHGRPAAARRRDPRGRRGLGRWPSDEERPLWGRVFGPPGSFLPRRGPLL